MRQEARVPVLVQLGVVMTVVAMVVVAVVALQPDGVAAAGAPIPQGGAWCGLTNQGGTVRMDVSRDGRWLNSISIRNPNSQVSSSESNLRKVQIVTGKFIVNRTEAQVVRRSVRCKKAPCRGGGTVVRRVVTASVRGRFDRPDQVHGTYTAANQSNGRRAVGSYVAWPASVAPCP